MDAQDLGPLFVPPHSEHYLWIVAAAIVLGAIVIAVVGLVRGRLGPRAALVGLLVLPAMAALLGNVVVMQQSTSTEFCGTCHVTMSPILASVRADDGSLASTHFAKGAVPGGEACYTCHSGYGLWGGVNAKAAGVNHMLHTVLRNYEFPLKMNAPFDIASCLSCHASNPAFRKSPAHQAEAVQTALLDRKMGCTGLCHPAAHPQQALRGAPTP